MTIFTRSRSIKALVSSAAIGVLLLGGGVSAASATDSNAEESALAQFRAGLTDSSDVQAFDNLSDGQRTDLAAYLLGETDPYTELSENAAREEAPSSVLSSGDFELQTEATATPTASAAARAATRSISAWQSFNFAGITISKTTVRETYYYSGANATKVASYSCVVDQNYDPFSQVTSSKNSAWVSSGKAIAECKVTVKRGVPTPWGPISWSTKSNVQYVSGNGAGKVTSSGWR